MGNKTQTDLSKRQLVKRVGQLSEKEQSEHGKEHSITLPRLLDTPRLYFQTSILDLAEFPNASIGSRVFKVLEHCGVEFVRSQRCTVTYDDQLSFRSRDGNVRSTFVS